MRDGTYKGLMGVDRTRTAERFPVWRKLVTGWCLVTAGLLAAYWLAWVADRSIVATDHTGAYTSFEQAFPLADAWLLGALLMAATQMWRRRPSALLWILVVGGAGAFLCAMDVLYDLQHGIYGKGSGGLIELTINVITGASSVGILLFGWRFRDQLLNP
jgi:hypothetical protein